MKISDWENVIVSWVNCLRLIDVPIASTQDLLDGIFLDQLLELVGGEKQSEDGRAKGLERVKTFLKDEFPEYLLPAEKETWDADDMTLVTSVILGHASLVTEDSGRLLRTPLFKLTHITQCVIHSFLEAFLTLHRPTVTPHLVLQCILDIDSENFEGRDKLDFITNEGGSSPLQQSPLFWGKRSTTSELRSLKNQVDLLNCEKSHLLEELEAAKVDIVSLQNDNKKKESEILRLGNELFVRECENTTQSGGVGGRRREKRKSSVSGSSGAAAILVATERRRHKEEIESLEKVTAELRTQLESFSSINDELQAKLTILERDANEWAWRLEESESRYRAVLCQKVELEASFFQLQRTYEEQGRMMAEKRSKELNESGGSTILDDIPGSGETMAAVIEMQFTELQQQHASQSNELFKARKINKELAQKCDVFKTELEIKNADANDLSQKILEERIAKEEAWAKLERAKTQLAALLMQMNGLCLELRKEDFIDDYPGSDEIGERIIEQNDLDSLQNIVDQTFATIHLVLDELIKNKQNNKNFEFLEKTEIERKGAILLLKEYLNLHINKFLPHSVITQIEMFMEEDRKKMVMYTENNSKLNSGIESNSRRLLKINQALYEIQCIIEDEAICQILEEKTFDSCCGPLDFLKIESEILESTEQKIRELNGAVLSLMEREKATLVRLGELAKNSMVEIKVKQGSEPVADNFDFDEKSFLCLDANTTRPSEGYEYLEQRLRHSIASLMHEISLKSEKIQELELKLENFCEVVEVNEEEIQRLGSELVEKAALIAERARLEDENCKQKEIINHINLTIELRDKELTQLQCQIKLLKQFTSKFEEATVKIEDLWPLLESLGPGDLGGVIKKLATMISFLEKSKESGDENMKLLNHAMDNLKMQNGVLMGEVKTRDARIEDMEKIIGSQTLKMNSLKRNLQSLADESKVKSDDTTSVLHTYEECFAAKEAEVTSLKEEITTLKGYLGELKQAECMWNQENARKDVLIEDLIKKRDCLASDLLACSEELNSTRASIRKHIEVAEHATHEAEHLKCIIQKYDEAMVRLKLADSQLKEKVNRVIPVSWDQNKILIDEIHKSREALVALERDIFVINKNKLLSINEIQGLERATGELQNVIRMKDAEIELLMSQLASNGSSTAVTPNLSIDTLKAEVEALQITLRERTRTLEEVEAVLIEDKVQISQLNASINQLHIELRAKGDELDILKLSLDEVKANEDQKNLVLEKLSELAIKYHKIFLLNTEGTAVLEQTAYSTVPGALNQWEKLLADYKAVLLRGEEVVKELNELKKENDALANQLTNWNEKSCKLECTLREEVMQLKAAVAAREQKIAEISVTRSQESKSKWKEIIELVASIENLNSEIASKNKDLVVARDLLEKSYQEKNSSLVEVQEIMSQLEDFRMETKRRNENHTRLAEVMSNLIPHVLADNKTNLEEFSYLTDKLRNAEDQSEEMMLVLFLRREVEIRRTQVKSFIIAIEEKDKQIELLKNDMRMKEVEIQRLTDYSKVQETELLQAKENSEIKKVEFEGMEKTLEMLRTELSCLKDYSEAKDAELQNLKENLGELDKQNMKYELEVMNREIEGLKEFLKEKDEHLKGLMVALATKEREIQDLEQISLKNDREMQSVTASLKARDGELCALKVHCEIIDTKLKYMNDSVWDKISQPKELQEEHMVQSLDLSRASDLDLQVPVEKREILSKEPATGCEDMTKLSNYFRDILDKWGVKQAADLICEIVDLKSCIATKEKVLRVVDGRRIRNMPLIDELFELEEELKEEVIVRSKATAEMRSNIDSAMESVNKRSSDLRMLDERVNWFLTEGVLRARIEQALNLILNELLPLAVEKTDRLATMLQEARCNLRILETELGVLKKSNNDLRTQLEEREDRIHELMAVSSESKLWAEVEARKAESQRLKETIDLLGQEDVERMNVIDGLTMRVVELTELVKIKESEIKALKIEVQYLTKGHWEANSTNNVLSYCNGKASSQYTTGMGESFSVEEDPILQNLEIIDSGNIPSVRYSQPDNCEGKLKTSYEQLQSNKNSEMPTLSDSDRRICEYARSNLELSHDSEMNSIIDVKWKFLTTESDMCKKTLTCSDSEMILSQNCSEDELSQPRPNILEHSSKCDMEKPSQVIPDSPEETDEVVPLAVNENLVKYDVTNLKSSILQDKEAISEPECDIISTDMKSLSEIRLISQPEDLLRIPDSGILETKIIKASIGQDSENTNIELIANVDSRRMSLDSALSLNTQFLGLPPFFHSETSEEKIMKPPIGETDHSVSGTANGADEVLDPVNDNLIFGDVELCSDDNRQQISILNMVNASVTQGTGGTFSSLVSNTLENDVFSVDRVSEKEKLQDLDTHKLPNLETPVTKTLRAPAFLSDSESIRVSSAMHPANSNELSEIQELGALTSHPLEIPSPSVPDDNTNPQDVVSLCGLEFCRAELLKMASELARKDNEIAAGLTEARALRQELLRQSGVTSELMQNVQMFEHEKTILEKRIEIMAEQLREVDVLKEELSTVRTRCLITESLLQEEKEKVMLITGQVTDEDKLRGCYNNKLLTIESKLKSEFEEHLQEITREYTGKIEQYKEKVLKDQTHIEELSSQLWEASDKFLVCQQQVESLRLQLSTAKAHNQQLINEIVQHNMVSPRRRSMSLQHICTSGVGVDNLGCEVLDSGDSSQKETIPPMFITETPQKSALGPIASRPKFSFLSGKVFPTADEEDVFDERYLANLKAGICHVPTTLVSKRMSCPSLSKGPRGKETRVKETECLLPAERPKKQKGQIAYRKPGPPTPCRNSGRLSLQGNERLAGSINSEQETKKGVVEAKPSKHTACGGGTPHRGIKSLFTSRHKSHQDSPHSRRLSFFQRKFKNRENVPP